MKSEVENLVGLIKQARFCFIAGNGGSASTAEHFTTDLVKKGYRAICLNSNVSVMTMLANDYGYGFIFSKQLEVYAAEKDLLITISCSGTSKNIVFAKASARFLRLNVYEFERFGKIKKYGQLENKHLRFAHEVVKKL